MPKVTIWIRKEDEEKWKAIKDKPQFIHGALELSTQKWWDETWRKWLEIQTTPVMLIDPEEPHQTSFKDER